MVMLAIYIDRFTVAFVNIRGGSRECITLVLGDGVQLWQSKPPQRAVHVFYENNIAKVVSERLMARHLLPYCYAAGQPQLRI